ncbi:MAG: GvpL/GvpF family gas vesicle protein [Thermoleophilaceae bacterium]
MYVYGVRRAGGNPPAARGVEDEPVRLVTSGQLAAIVSAAPPGDVRASRRNLMAHTTVLQEAVAERCVLPMRFGVVMPDEAAVRHELLELHEEQLLAQLDAFESLVELDVKVLCPEEALLREVVEQRPEIRRAPATTYHDRIALGELVARAVAAKREELAGAVLGRLGPLAAAAEAGEPLHDDMAASVALLVERTRVPQVDAAVEKLEAELGPSCRIRYVGPLPPYSFTGLDAAAEERAWA